MLCRVIMAMAQPSFCVLEAGQPSSFLTRFSSRGYDITRRLFKELPCPTVLVMRTPGDATLVVALGFLFLLHSQAVFFT
jgi:hypothetical protein